MKVLEVSPIERDLYPESPWEGVVVKEVKNSLLRVDRGRGNEDQQTFRVNFWDLIYPEEETTSLSQLCSSLLPSEIEELELRRVNDSI